MNGPEIAQELALPRALATPRGSRVRALASSASASCLLALTLRRVDALVGAVSGGRASATALLAGLPVVTLTTRGARSGRPRTVRLVPVVTPETLAVLGTNFGAPRTPAWVLNLLAHPVGTVAHGDRRLQIRARELDGSSRDDVLRAAVLLYPGFAQYLARAAHRQVHVFALEA